MPYLETAQSWLTQSTLLIKARPSTTHITTKYTIAPPTSKKSKSRKSKSAPTSTTEPTSQAANLALAPDAPRATLTLKTFDPVSGATLKYTTNKAAEVSRLIQILGRLARPMSGLPEVKEDVGMIGAGAGAGAEGEGSGAGTPAVESVPAVVGGGKPGQQAQGGGAGGKKKKKGKK